MLSAMINGLARHLEFYLMKYGIYAPDFDKESIENINCVKPYTMTSATRLFALIQAVKYVAKANIPGSIVECGVWRGGSMMAAARTLKRLNKSDVDLYLFDTYEGMTTPTEADISFTGLQAANRYQSVKRGNARSDWCYAPLEDVQKNLFSTGYDKNKMKFIKGKVEDTIPQSAPGQISILRLDTDWYESTKHELIHLYPRLTVGGVLIIDDYGFWKGSRKATDEYFAQNNIPILLNRIDSTGRIAVKTN